MPDEITIYWSSGEDEQKLPFNRQMLYLPPVNLYKDLLPRQNPDLVGAGRGLRDSSFFVCPAVRDKLSRTFFMENSVETRFSVRDFEIVAESGVGIPLATSRDSSLTNTVHVRSELTWMFFADEPLEVSFTSPYFHALEYLSAMTLPPAQFNIGTWFRSFNCEYIVQRRHADIVIHEGDPMFYMEVHSQKKIRFVRFEVCDELSRLGASCSGAPAVLGRFKPLAERYERFRATQMRENILRLIKPNIIGAIDA